MRTFKSGATRDSDCEKIDPEGFLSPAVVQRFCEYMHAHRVQADGSLRDSDNWTRGMPKDAYIKSAFRHFLDLWHAHRGTGQEREGVEDALCAILFNAQGYLYEVLLHKACSQPCEGETHWKAEARAEVLNDTFKISVEDKRDSIWTGEDVDSRWGRSSSAAAAGDTRGRIVPRFAEEDGECECPKAQSEERNYSLYDFGTFAMRESDYENRRSMGLWNDPVKARKTLDWCLQNGWARRIG